jgi:mannose-6-phosphate isomerase
VQRIYKLKGVIQPYAWGGSEFIPSITGLPSNGKPAAEYWLGAHPLAPSVLDVEGQPALPDMIRENPQYFLGNNSSTDSLPFLVKLQDVKEMLSIQVHPEKEAAAECFEKENKAGIPLDAPHRNYRDPNRKEEMLVPLSDFWLLHGFRTPDLLKDFFSIPEFARFEEYYNKGGYQLLYTTIMRLPQAEVNEILKPLAERVTLLYHQNTLSKNKPDYWAAKALRNYFSDGNLDRGIFSIYLLNVVHLRKGEALYQSPGVLHAYLQGQTVEVMSNSDNVLRAGLTPKHIDVEELLSHVSYEATVPDIKPSASISRYSYQDFIVEHLHVSLKDDKVLNSPAILLVVEGEVTVTAAEEKVSLKKGSSVYIVPNTTFRAETSPDADYFLVSGKIEG